MREYTLDSERYGTIRVSSNSTDDITVDEAEEEIRSTCLKPGASLEVKNFVGTALVNCSIISYGEKS